MEKVRLVVMNKQCITQVVGPDQKWRDAKIEKALERPPGIYNLHTATPADPAKTHEGVILYVQGGTLFQQVGKAVVSHEVAKFDVVPEPGVHRALSYGQDHVTVTAVQPRPRTRTL